MDHRLRDPRTVAVAVAVVLLLLMAVGWVITSRHLAESERTAQSLLERMTVSQEDVERARHEVKAAGDLCDQLRAGRDQQVQARRKIEDELTQAVAGNKAALAAQTEAEKGLNRATREAERIEAERKAIAADRDHQYQERRALQDRYDELNKSFQALRQQTLQSADIIPKAPALLPAADASSK